MRTRHVLAALLLGCAVLAPTATGAGAQYSGRNGDAEETSYAVGVQTGTITTGGNVNPAPDGPTTVSVGGDSNLGVGQPDLGRVPAGAGDGIFSVISAPVVGASGPMVSDGATVSESTDSTASAPTVSQTAPAPEPVYEEAAAESGPSCYDYGSWYDAQLALEESGDPAIAAALDPDGNGIACESAME